MDLDSIGTLLTGVCALMLILIFYRLSQIHAGLRGLQMPTRPGKEAIDDARVCIECQQRGTAPPAHWAAVSGKWVVDRTEGDVDGVLRQVGYGPLARSTFKLMSYGAGVAEIDIVMHDGHTCTLTFGGGPMPATTNRMRVDGTLQTFVGNEGIPGDDRYTVAMWWEGEHMVAWGEHRSGTWPRLDTRRYLQYGRDGKRHSELVVERTVNGISSRMIYARHGGR